MKTKLYKERVKRGLSELDLAKELGVSYYTISRLENGHHYPDNYTSTQLKEFFGIDAGELMKEYVQPDKNTFSSIYIKKIMNDKHLTLENLVNTGYICIHNARLILNNHMRPSPSAIFAFSKALCMDYDEEVEDLFYHRGKR